MSKLMYSPTLQLNASYEALRIITARHALKLVTKGVAVVEISTNHEVYPGIYLPSVIRLREYKRIPIRMQLPTRKSIYARDGYRCGYCLKRFKGDHLTLDHIVPKSRGGKGTWDNLVTACRLCNHRKADRTPEEANMPLLRRPLPVTVHTSRLLLRTMASDVKEWQKYLYHDNKGDERFGVVVN